MRIEETRAITLPNLLGIDRRIAYANIKYFSGWIWAGVTNGLAGMKLSGSPRRYGLVRDRATRKKISTINPTVSLIVK